MKVQEIEFKCFYCHEEIKYGEPCYECDIPISWDGIELAYTDKYLEIYKVWVK